MQRLPELEVMLAKTGGKVGKVVEYTSYPEAYQDLALSRTDYVINTVINLNALVKEKPAVFECGDRGRTVGRDRHRGIAARSYVELRAERAVLAVLSNCPQMHNPCNGYNPTSVRLIVRQPG